MDKVKFYIYNAGTSGKLIKTDDVRFKQLNTGLILNVMLYNTMMKISTIVSNAGCVCVFKVGGRV